MGPFEPPLPHAVVPHFPLLHGGPHCRQLGARSRPPARSRPLRIPGGHLSRAGLPDYRIPHPSRTRRVRKPANLPPGPENRHCAFRRLPSSSLAEANCSGTALMSTGARSRCAGWGSTPGDSPPSPRRNGPFRLITVGRLSPEKGHPVLLSALERLARTGRQLRLTVVGDGPFRKSLEKAAAQKGLADRSPSRVGSTTTPSPPYTAKPTHSPWPVSPKVSR